MIGRIPEPVSDTITRRCSRVELHRRQRVQLRQQGLQVLGWLRNPELPRGPVLIPAANCDHPIKTPVRHTPLKIGNDNNFSLDGAGQFEDAIDAHARAATILREIGDRLQEGRALSNLGFALAERDGAQSGVNDA